MKTVKPLDLAFLLTESSSRCMHMCAFMLFDPPARERETFVPRLLTAYRQSEIAAPFNQKLKWLGKGVAAWETVEPDLNYHLRHIAIPKPGTMKQFYENISFINSTLLDRGHPLWECYVIEGLENGRFALMIKIHHALIDGEAGLRVLRGFLSDSPRDKTLRAPWMPLAQPKPKRRGASGTAMERAQQVLGRLRKLPGDLIGMGGEVVNLGAQGLNLRPRNSALPFAARRTLFNNQAQSAERRYANCELSLDRVVAIAKASATSINDVLMTAIDAALHSYLELRQQPTGKPLVAIMPMSLRAEGESVEGNQVTVDLIPMGLPQASLNERLQQIHAATQRAKEKGRALPRVVRDFYALFVFGSTTASAVASVFAKLPSSNLVISNMKGPTEPLYLGGASLAAFHGLPIVPPGGGLNVTFASMNRWICLGVGAAPEAVDDPLLLTQLIAQSLNELETEMLGKTTPRRRKTTSTIRDKTKEKLA